MENTFRNNIIEFSTIYLNKTFNLIDNNQNEFNPNKFTYYIYKQLWDIDINEQGYGLDDSTKQLTNNIGDLKIYNEDDPQKINYLEDIQPGDLVFFHTKEPEANFPNQNNHYPGHVGLYIGNNKFIHLSPTEEKLTIDKIENNWLNKLVASRDIIKEIIIKDLNNKIK